MPRRDPHPIRTWSALAVAGALWASCLASNLPGAMDAVATCLGVRP